MLEIEVICAGAVKAALSSFESGLADNPGVRLCTTYGPVGQLKKRILAGEASAQLYILNQQAVNELNKAELIRPNSVTPLGTVGVGIAVPSGESLPDVSSVDALRDTLLAAPSLTYGDPAHGDSSGTHFAEVLRILGLADVLDDKIQLSALGMEVVEKVAAHQIALGATQSSVILANPHVSLAGLLPNELQRFTTYVMALSVTGGAAAEAVWFHLASSTARICFASFGFAGKD